MFIREKTELLFSMFTNLPEGKKEELSDSFKKGIVLAYHMQDYVYVTGSDYATLLWNEEDEPSQ